MSLNQGFFLKLSKTKLPDPFNGIFYNDTIEVLYFLYMTNMM